MSFVIAVPELLTATASELANIGSAVSAANAAAVATTTGVLAAGADEVSVAIAAMFGTHGQAYQAGSDPGTGGKLFGAAGQAGQTPT